MAQQTASAAGANHTFSIRGLIAGVRTRESGGRTIVRTLIKCPSADPYKGPSTFEVESLRRLGSKGGEVDTVVQLVGYSDSWKDKETGEIVQTARHVLRAVESQ